MQKSFACALAVVTILALGVASAAESPDKEHAELAKALVAAKVSLGGGLTAAATAGKPISTKFEVDGGKLQLSVDTEKSGKFSEVLIDDVTGKLAKSAPITEGEDLAAAKSQSEAMGKAKTSLSTALSKAVAETPGFHATSVLPSLARLKPVDRWAGVPHYGHRTRWYGSTRTARPA
jgi:hypothetical protein